MKIVIVAKGLDKAPDRLRRFREGIVARVGRMLALSGEEIVGISRDKYLSGPRPEFLGRVSGELARKTIYEVRGNTVFVGSNLPYARVHELGAVIRPRRAKRLVFKLLDGSWRSATEVKIPARPFLRPALKDAREGIRSIVNRLSNEALREAMA